MLLLDTNVCVEVLRARNSAVVAAYRKLDPGTILIPNIVAGELLFGAARSHKAGATGEATMFLAAHEIIPFGEDELESYVAIRLQLELRGLRIGANDLIIAATVLSRNATLVTHNTKEFSRVDGLNLLDWEI